MNNRKSLGPGQQPLPAGAGPVDPLQVHQVAAAEQRKRAAEWAENQEKLKQQRKDKAAEELQQQQQQPQPQTPSQPPLSQPDTVLTTSSSATVPMLEAATAGAGAAEVPGTPRRGVRTRKSGNDDASSTATPVSVSKRTRRSSLDMLPVVPEEIVPVRRTTRRSSLGPVKGDDDDMSVVSAMTEASTVSAVGRRSSRVSLGVDKSRIPHRKTAPTVAETEPTPLSPVKESHVESESSVPTAAEGPVVEFPVVVPDVVVVPPLPQLPKVEVVETACSDPECEPLPSDVKIESSDADQLAVQDSLDQCFRAVGIAGVAVGLYTDYEVWLFIVFFTISLGLLRRLCTQVCPSCFDESAADDE